MKTIDELHSYLDFYMTWKVNGDKFFIEQDFEDALREVLDDAGFEVLEKQDVEHANEAVSGRTMSGRVERLIPDIAVACEDGLVFLELKFCRELSAYDDDIEKCQRFLDEEKCAAAGVLFLDDEPRAGWKACRCNKDFNYYLAIGQ